MEQMYPRFFILFFVLSNLGVSAQNRRFINLADETEPVWYHQQSATETNLHLDRFDANHICGITIDGLNEFRTYKSRKPFGQDSLLNQIAAAGMSTFNRSSFTISRTWSKERKSIHFVLRNHQSEYRAYNAHAFVVDLLDLDMSKSFYYDSKPETSDIDLYAGKPSEVKDPTDEEYVEPKPLELISEISFIDRFIEEMSSGERYRDLMSRKYERVGISLKLNPFSMRSNRRPTLFVIVVFAGKVMQQVRVPQSKIGDDKKAVR